MMLIYTMHYSSFGCGFGIKHVLQLLPKTSTQKEIKPIKGYKANVNIKLNQLIVS